MEAEAVSDLSDPAFRGSGNRGIRDRRTHRIKKSPDTMQRIR